MTASVTPTQTLQRLRALRQSIEPSRRVADASSCARECVTPQDFTCRDAASTGCVSDAPTLHQALPNPGQAPDAYRCVQDAPYEQSSSAQAPPSHSISPIEQHQQLIDWLRRPNLQRRLQLSPPHSNLSATALIGQPIASGLHVLETRHPLTDIPAELRFQHRDPAIDPRHLMAIDTETTGLAGGTGTRAFLIGVGFIEQNELCLRQWLLSGLGGEPAMLQAFADCLASHHHLLSYNGKSYDLPLLRTRFCLHRQQDPSSALAHTDLVHLVRRRYRGAWADCRLQTAERQLLAIVRNDDLPGSEAPAAFRRWLQSGDAAQLNRVVEHNAQDLISLMRLALRLGDIDPEQYRLSAAAAGPRLHA